MHELRRKMFLTLFGLLSVLVWVLVGVFDFQDYFTTQEKLSNSMTEIANLTKQVWNPAGVGPIKSELEPSTEKEPSKIDLLYEYPVYLITFNNSDEPIQAYTSRYEYDDIEANIWLAKDIVKTQRAGVLHTGNLYADDYAWYHPDNNSVLLVGIESIRHDLVSHLVLSIVIGVVFEVLLYLVCTKIVSWMILPIEETFDKQRQFIADASHELKTPVAVIQANAEAMEKDPDPKWLNNIEEEAVRMNGLITDLLNLTRNEQQEFNAVPVDLSRIVQKQCLIQEAVMFEKNIELTQEITEHLMVSGQSSMLEQLVAILLDNAAAHSTGKIFVSVKRRGKDVILDVSNTGSEIPLKDRERIFERFYRADESRTRSSGRYGLGLAIAKSIIERHKAKIEVLCANGITTFRCTFRFAQNNS